MMGVIIPMERLRKKMERKEYIERDAALRVLCDACGNAACPKGLIPRCSYYEKMQSIPAADVRPVVRGKWIDRDDDYYGWNMWACSACGEEFVLTEGTPDMNEYHFCPNCGARMEG